MAKTIFLLEDDDLTASIFTHWLKKDGYKVVRAKSIKEARRLLKEEKPPALFWLDYYLKGDKTGIDFLRIIQKDRRFRDTPKIFVTVTVTVQKLKEFKDLGAQEAFPKLSTNRAAILETIKDVLKD